MQNNRSITETELGLAAAMIARHFDRCSADEPYFAARDALAALGFAIPPFEEVPPGPDMWA